MFLIAIALRMFLVLTACGIADDGCAYGSLAKEIAMGNLREAFTYLLPPLFPIFIAGASYIFHDIELSGRMVSCLFGSLTVFPLYLLAKNIFDKKIALITVLFFVVHPYLFQTSGEVLTEALYYFLVTSIASLCWIAIQKRKRALFLIVGLLLFLTSLARSEGVALAFLVFAWIWLINFPKIKTEIRWKLLSSFICLMTLIAVSVPYLFFVHKGTGKWQIDSRQEECVGVFFKPVSENQSPLQRAGALAKKNIFKNTPRVPSRLVKAYHPIFLPFLLFGVIRRKRFKGFKIGEIYILSFILYRIIMLIVIAGITSRYFYAFIPIALCWAGAGFWEIDCRLQKTFKDKNLLIGKTQINCFSIIILAVILAICLPRGLRPIREHRAIQKEAGYWLRENTEQKEFVVVSPSPQEAFYAGASWYVLKGKTYTEVINNARIKKADFIIIDRNITTACPDFKDSVKVDDLEILTNKFEEDDRKIVIYKLLERAR